MSAWTFQSEGRCFVWATPTCRRVFTISSGLVAAAATVPPILHRKYLKWHIQTEKVSRRVVCQFLSSSWEKVLGPCNPVRDSKDSWLRSLTRRRRDDEKLLVLWLRLSWLNLEVAGIAHNRVWKSAHALGCCDEAWLPLGHGPNQHVFTWTAHERRQIRLTRAKSNMLSVSQE